MNMYVLIFTLALKSGYGGFGGVTTVEVVGLKNCNRIGNAWVTSTITKSKFKVDHGEAFFTCVRKNQ